MSVKEAISAVDSVAKVMAKNGNATLDEALKVLGAKSDLHPALKGRSPSFTGTPTTPMASGTR